MGSLGHSDLLHSHRSIPGGVGNVGVGDEVTVVPRLLLSDEEGSCTLGEGSTSETSGGVGSGVGGDMSMVGGTAEEELAADVV
jgi:hypothetical protein